MLVRAVIPGRLACWIACVVVASSVGWPGREAGAGGLLVADGGLGGALEIASHEVRVTINNGVAVTEVEQVFRNTEGRVLEALYTFPVPNGASVANFSMWIGGKEMVGEVVEKQRARDIYDSYKRKNVDPGLLEQVDYKTFEMRIFPIPANGEQRVSVSYYQELDVDDDWATYVYPLATATRRDVDTRVHGRFSLAIEVKSEIPIVGMASPSHGDAMLCVGRNTGYWQSSLEAVGADLDRDVVLAYHLERPVTGFDLITSKARGEDGYLLATLTVGKELADLDQGMDYLFVSDVSGSMANDGKLGVTNRAVAAFVEVLGDADRFEIIAFNTEARALFQRLTASAPTSLLAARQFLDEQRARGGTRLRPAVEAAYRYRDADRPLNVVILSDGMTEQDEQQELLRLIRGRPAGVRVFCIGVGNEVNRPLLRQIAGDAGGLAAFVSHGDDLERQARGFRRKLLRPAATDVRIRFDGGEVYDFEPAVLPNLYHGSPLRLYARYRRPGKTAVQMTANVMGHAIEQTFDLVLPEQDDDDPEIERMWAWHRVESLMDQDRGSGGAQHVDEIVRLCEGYSITSEYASFLVLENDGEYQRWKIDRRNATRIARDRTARAALRTRLERMREVADARIGPLDGAAPEQVTATPAIAPVPTVPAAAPRNAPPPPPPAAPKRGHDFDLPRPRGGGGAIDPLSGLCAVSLAAAACLGRRRAGRAEQQS